MKAKHSRDANYITERQRPPLSDVMESFVSATDVKHYLYCPRIVYFDRVLHLEPQLGSQQEESLELHKEYMLKELRRKDAIYYSPDFENAEKFLFVPLSSSLGLQGVVDCIIKTKRGELIPVDYKNMPSNHGRIWMDHRYQLVAYSLLIDENYGVQVRRGFINYIPDGLILSLSITPTMKTYVRRLISHIRTMIRDERLPPIHIAKQKCTGGCGYKEICRRP
jgi:CRISPR-associated exonuclease Cas4